MSTREGMLVIKRGYDLSKWLLDHTGKFPKSYRFSVAASRPKALAMVFRPGNPPSPSSEDSA